MSQKYQKQSEKKKNILYSTTNECQAKVLLTHKQLKKNHKRKTNVSLWKKKMLLK